MSHHIALACGLLLALSGAGAAKDGTITPLRHDLAERNYDAACASCHYRGPDRPAFGTRGPAGDSTPDELVQYILFGAEPEEDEGGMPGFAVALTDEDVTRMVVWLRSRSVPDAPWAEVAASVVRMRATGERED